MKRARFSIGIDLGTTNCALAFMPLHGEARSETFAVPQWETLSSLTESLTLPCFLYLPEDAVAAQIQARDAGKGEWVVGRLAREKAGEAPGRVVHSAKSWLCHHAADRSARFLPWGSEEIARDKKMSPVRASALTLNYLKGAWNSRFANSGVDFEFDNQEITVTVPASFDVAAQRLTLTAAEEAGFPETVRLLEEPQAAFYCWLEQHGSVQDLWGRISGHNGVPKHLLVVDIGGGTSDFSLFELRANERSPAPKIKRVAVSDHILLGGDNVDLALAHFLEPRLVGERGQFSGTQWDDLVGRCRDLKEKALSSEGPPDEAFPVSLPGRGSSLVASLHSAKLTRAEINGVLLEGFFPECNLNARPYRTQAALREWGLPYASDSAVTRHLADFLRDRPRIDALLFNGGSLHPQILRQRISQQIEKWQGLTPLVLENAEPRLAVARGAARFGRLLYRKAERIAADAVRSVFLEVHPNPATNAERQTRPSLVCVLPQGAAPEEQFEIANPAFEVRTNCLVRFQAYYSGRHGTSKAGDIVDWSERDLHAIPPLETMVKTADRSLSGIARALPVRLTTKMNELGLLQVCCVSADPEIPQSWPLEFNLRRYEQESERGSGPETAPENAVQAEPNVETDVLEAARRCIALLFGRPVSQADKLTAARLVKSLERILGRPKSEWNWVLVRALWPALESCMALRKESVDHEEAWLALAGFLLRPGFGVAGDDVRLDNLWRLREVGLYYPGKRSKSQEYILWRRVAGGLGRERQERILAAELDKILRHSSAPAELIRLAGSLELISHEGKAELIKHFLGVAVDLAHEKKHCAPYLAALGLLLNRAPLYAGPETVVSPDLVERAYEVFRAFDWAKPELSDLQTLFIRAARVVGNRSLDLRKSLRNHIADKLEQSGVAPLRTGKLREFAPIGRGDRISLFGESLPPGLVFS